MTTKIPMTKKGADLLHGELMQLKTIERPEVIHAISEARAHGDLKENAEYHAAKEKQAFIEGRIAEIETKLANAQIIDTSLLQADKVVFGVSVTVLNIDANQQKHYHIVGVDEADLKSSKISINSPLARALIGHRIGDEVDVETPQGIDCYEIIDIKVGH